MKHHALSLALLALAALGLTSCRSSLSSLTATNDTVNIIAFNGQRHAVNTAQCIPYDDAPEYDFFCTWPGERNIGEFSHEVYLYTKTRLTPGTYTFADSNIEDLDSAAAHGKVEAFVSLDSDHRSSRLVHCFVNPCGLPVSSVSGQLTVARDGDRYTFTATGLDNYSAPFRFHYMGRLPAMA